MVANHDSFSAPCHNMIKNPEPAPVTPATPDSMTPVIDIRNLHKAYGELEVLKGVSVRALPGQVISLIGSSGSGKSTLLRCCNLLEDSQQGVIKFEGEAVEWRGEGLNRHPADRAQVTRTRQPCQQQAERDGAG